MSQEEQEQQKFWTQNFFRLKFFFRPNFLNQKFFQTPNLFYLNFFRIKNFFLPKIIFGPIFFRPNIFSESFSENNVWREKTKLPNVKLSKLTRAKVLLKLEFDTEDQVLFLIFISSSYLAIDYWQSRFLPTVSLYYLYSGLF